NLALCRGFRNSVIEAAQRGGLSRRLPSRAAWSSGSVRRLRRRVARYPDAEAGPRGVTRLVPCLAPYGLGEAAHDGEAEAGPLRLPLGSGTTAEALEQAGHELVGDAGADVAHLQLDPAVALRDRHLDGRCPVFEGVLDVVGEDLPHVLRVGPGDQAGNAFHPHVAGPVAQFRQPRENELRGVEGHGFGPEHARL